MSTPFMECSEEIFNWFVLGPEVAMQHVDIGNRTFPLLGDEFVQRRVGFKAVCVTDRYALNGHWVWGCPSDTEFAPAYVPIPLMVNQPPLKTTGEMMIEAQRLRQLRLQNEIQQQQLEEMRRANVAREAESRRPVEPPVEPPAPKPAEPSKIAEQQIRGEWNGRFWNSMSENYKMVFVIGYADATDFVSHMATADADAYRVAHFKYWPVSLSFGATVSALNRFYEVTENAPIPVRHALMIVAAGASGSSGDKIREMTLVIRVLAQNDAKKADEWP